MLSNDEKKIILKYLIKNNCIQNAKGVKVWTNMLDEGVSIIINSISFKFLFLQYK